MKTGLLLLGVISTLTLSHVSEAAKKGASRGAPPSAIGQETTATLVTRGFERWDRNKDRKLDRKETVALIENPAVRGVEAALVVQVFNTYFSDVREERPALAFEQLLEQAKQPKFAQGVSKLMARLGNATRAIFLPSDPNLSALDQGAVGDCYLVAAVGAAVARDPRSIRNMFKPATNGFIEVRWGNRKTVTIPPLTNAELIMGAKLGRDRGIWLNVFEKAYAALKEEHLTGEDETPFEEDDKAAKDLVGHGGLPGRVIQAITGHQTFRFRLSKVKSASDAETRVHDLLQRLASERRLMVCGGGGGARPPHVPSSHAYAVLAYDPNRRGLHLFNPLGTNFTPKGPPGVKAGYLTREGRFSMPLKEFIEVFGVLIYETDKNLN